MSLILCKSVLKENFLSFKTQNVKGQEKTVCLQGGTQISHLKSLKASKFGEININMLSS